MYKSKETEMTIKFFHSICCKLSLATGIIFLLSSFTFTNSLKKMDSKSYVKELSPSKKLKYQKDATRLALRLISKDEDYQNMKVEVPKEMVCSIYDALVAVHFSEIEEAKQVTKSHKLHTFPVPTIDNFLVVYKRDADWARSLRLGDNEIDNEDMKAYCDKYHLKISNHVEWDEEHNSFSIQAVEAMNIAPIAAKFEAFEGVSKVDILAPNGDGNDIEIVKTESGWSINYIVKFDSCFTNCKKRHSWKFNISKSGNVEFVEEKGDDLPIWMAKR